MGPGFDALRLGLSVTILCWHSVLASYGRAAELAIWDSPLSAPFTALLPVFFALSGFLVIGSAIRNPDLTRFVALRGLRILPALTTEICVSAVLLGSTITTLGKAQYFTSPVFFRYFGSLVGDIKQQLPGVFETNPDPGIVNVSLWTIAPELLCYVYMACLLLLGVQGRKWLMTGIVAVICATSFAADMAFGDFMEAGVVNPRLLVASFGLGNVVYLWRHALPFHWACFAAAAVLGTLTLRVPGCVYLSMLCLTYCLVYVGLLNVPRIPVLSNGDYSYGIYLYAFPIQQTVAALAPWARHWWINIAIALPVTLLLAMASWRFVEKPALTLRRHLPPARAGTARGFAPAFFGLLGLLVYGSFLLHWSGVVEWHDFGVGVGQAFLAAAVAAFVLALVFSLLSPTDPPRLQAPTRL